MQIVFATLVFKMIGSNLVVLNIGLRNRLLKCEEGKRGEFVASGLVPAGGWSCLFAATASMLDEL